MSSRQTGWILVAVGLALVALGLSADFIGAGAVPGFGFKQMGATAVGIIVAAVGLRKVSKR